MEKKILKMLIFHAPSLTTRVSTELYVFCYKTVHERTCIICISITRLISADVKLVKTWAYSRKTLKSDFRTQTKKSTNQIIRFGVSSTNCVL